MYIFLAVPEVDKEEKAEEKKEASPEKIRREISPEPDTDLPETELEKYWRAVKENPQDFTGWTYLLQYVEQEVRSHFPD